MSAIEGVIWLDGRAGEQARLFAYGAAVDYRCNETDLHLVGVLRIDNGPELRRALGVERSVTDQEVVVAAYSAWGPACAERIVGDFAFAIWDPHRRQLYCARDAMGVRPLYYSSRPGRVLVFGSDIGMVLAHQDVSDAINEGALADLFEGTLEDHTTTLYRHVSRLPAAHHLVADQSGVRVRRYWQFDRVSEIALGSDAEYEEGYRAHLTEAVRCRLPGNGSVGAMLSGGLDSSSVACVARDLLVEQGLGPLATFSHRFSDAPASDERAHIDAVLGLGGFDPRFNEGGRHDPLGHIDDLLDLHHGPFFGANTFLVAALGRLAREAGLEVLLDGFGGDSTTSHGWLRLRELGRHPRPIELAREVQAFGSELGRPWPAAYGALVWNETVWPRLPRRARKRFRGGVRAAARQIGRASTRGETLGSVLHPDFEARAFKSRSPTKRELYGSLFSARDQHFYQVTTGIMPMATEITDRVARSLGIDYRYPFLDRRLAEYCLGLPSNQKLRDGWTRSIARRALVDVLPPEVSRRRDKADLSHNFGYVLRTSGHGALRDVIDDPGPLEGILATDILRDANRRFEDGRASPEDTQFLWLAVLTKRWLLRRSEAN